MDNEDYAQTFRRIHRMNLNAGNRLRTIKEHKNMETRKIYAITLSHDVPPGFLFRHKGELFEQIEGMAENYLMLSSLQREWEFPNSLKPKTVR